MKIIDTPQIAVLKSGRSVKVLRVTGEEGMVIPEHFCTKEAVLVVQRGSAILEMEGTVISLARDQTVIIPGGANHTLNIKERFQAIVMMCIDSEIKFVNQ
jgi:quercetin dioxygenase-like cupin family protein